MATTAVIFDIDGTLTPIMSWLDFTSALGASVDAHRAIFRDYLDERVTYAQSREQLIGLWQATGRAQRAIIEDIFADWPLDKAAQPLIHDIIGHGRQVCLITGSFDTYASSVAHRLGVTHWYANTRFVFAPDGQLTSFHYVRDQAGEKLAQFQKFLQAAQLSADECLAVGDGPNDLELFRATGRGIFLEPAFAREDLADVRAAAWRQAASLAAAHDIIKPLLVTAQV